MLHYILVKWTDGPVAKQALAERAQSLFSRVTELPGVRGVSVRRGVISGDNRCDLMICMELDRQALPGYDASALHRAWKEEFAPYIRQKTIFDCEE